MGPVKAEIADSKRKIDKLYDVVEEGTLSGRAFLPSLQV
jgi:hypothetical protein